jgi:predicted  nucleic acid-binding Zn-ribbon protein
MNLAKKLYDLQYLDSEIHSRHSILNEIDSLLGNDEAVKNAEADLLTAKNHLSAKEKEHKDLEWEVEELRNKTMKVNEKLYGGKITNTKELLNLKQEAESFKTQQSQKEDILLEIMAEEETAQEQILSRTEKTKELKEEWQKEQKVLSQKRAEIENQVMELNEKRDELISDIESQVLGIYEGLKSRKGQAVVKVEQGRCQGCRITLSTSELQRVRGGNLVHCGSCGMILYLG